MQNQKPEDELKDIQLEAAKLQLEDLKWQIEKRRQEKLQKQISHEQVEADLSTYRRNVAASQAQCNHRKGGRGVEGLQGNGTDGQHSLIHHRFADGRIGVMCSRCQKMWMPGEPGYAEAIKLPTDNTMSEATQFRFEKVVL